MIIFLNNLKYKTHNSQTWMKTLYRDTVSPLCKVKKYTGANVGRLEYIVVEAGLSLFCLLIFSP